MRTLCAWCGRPIVDEPADPGGPISHGICAPCILAVEFDSKPLHAFLQSTTDPVIAVDADGRLLGATRAFADLVGKEMDRLRDVLAGNAISCEYSALPEGCGHTVHCASCTVRRAFEETMASGEARVRIDATAYVQTAQGPARLVMQLSTQRVGHAVLVRIDSAVAEPADACQRV